MPKTSGDELFERYLREHGYDPGEHEPDLSEHGIAKRPDFLARLGEVTVACEVEQFTPGSSAVERRLAGQRTATASAPEVYRPVRKRIESAAKQLKPLTRLQLPLVVVLANPDGAMVDLSVDGVIAALYGNPTWRMTIDTSTGAAVDEGRMELGRDGKLTNDHPYLSAIVLLRWREHRVDRIAEIAAEQRSGGTDFDTTASEAAALLKRLEAEKLPEGDYVYVDVIETLSEQAIPLGEEWFVGSRDSRWRVNADGYFECVCGSPRR
jgi:hypothetical protein